MVRTMDSILLLPLHDKSFVQLLFPTNSLWSLVKIFHLTVFLVGFGILCKTKTPATIIKDGESR